MAKYTLSHATMFFGDSAYPLNGFFDEINPEDPNAKSLVARALWRHNPALSPGMYLQRMEVEDLEAIRVSDVDPDVRELAKAAYPSGIVAQARRVFQGNGFCVVYLKQEEQPAAGRLPIEDAWVAESGVYCLTKDGRYWKLSTPTTRDTALALVEKIRKVRSINPQHWVASGDTNNDPDWASTTAEDEYNDANG